MERAVCRSCAEGDDARLWNDASTACDDGARLRSEGANLSSRAAGGKLDERAAGVTNAGVGGRVVIWGTGGTASSAGGIEGYVDECGVDGVEYEGAVGVDGPENDDDGEEGSPTPWVEPKPDDVKPLEVRSVVAVVVDTKTPFEGGGNTPFADTGNPSESLSLDTYAGGGDGRQSVESALRQPERPDCSKRNGRRPPLLSFFSSALEPLPKSCLMLQGIISTSLPRMHR